MAEALDRLDLKVLDKMLNNARQSLRSIAKELGVPTSTVHERVRKLVRLGVIRRFTAELNPRALGLDLTALVLISVEGAHITEVEKTLSSYDNVVAVYDITGDFDVALIAKFRSIDELNAFIKGVLKMSHVKRTVTSVVFNVVKERLCIDSINLIKEFK